MHRPFFFAAIAFMLTLGATWGATLLWRIGFGQSFTAATALEVNAHGLAQIYGWMGMFIMGFAYTVFPRMWRSPSPSKWLVMFAFGANVAGVLLGAAGMRFAEAWNGAPMVSLVGTILIVLSVIVFGAQIVSAFERRRAPLEPAFLFMLAAVGWFVLSAVFSAAHTWMSVTATDREKLLEVISTYQAALRDMQIHGVALTLILGVSLKILPGMFGLPKITDRRAMLILALVTLAVAGETSFFIASRWGEMYILAGVMYLFWIMLAVGVGAIVVKWQPWRPLPRDDSRSGKFIRAAYLWLAISLAMLLLMPLVQVLLGTPFSHAYYGAARHAITVGFISMMIMGIAAKFVPAMRGVAWRALSALRVPFILVNIGCALRVILQIGTDVHPLAFTLVGVSSVLEVVGFGWWGLEIVRIMLGRVHDASASSLPLWQRPPEPLNSADSPIQRFNDNDQQLTVNAPHACCSMCEPRVHQSADA